LLASGARGDDELELLAELLSLPSTGAGLNFRPQRKREMLFEALLHQLEALARTRPVVMIFEDAHWIDPTSRELLDLTIDRASQQPILLIVTFRPEFQQAWGGQAHVTVLALNRLGDRDVTALVRGLAGNAPLGSEIVEEIVERTDGVPLFIEELTRAVLERADQGNRVAAVLSATPLPAAAVPATLHASLLARIDRIGAAAKEVAQIGAVLGREFSYELIRPIAQRSDAELQATLARLAEAGLLFCRGIAPHSSYLFKHALVQDAAYGTLLRARRQELHARVGAVLEEHFADLVERQPELLAHHLTAAGNTERAIEQWLRAGQHAIRRSANTEGIAHFTRGVEALRTLTPTDAPSRIELELLLALGPTLSATHGWSAPAAERAYSGAERLASALGADRERFDATWGLWMIQNTGDAPELARKTSIQLFQIADRLNDPSLQMEAHHAAWACSHTLGDHAATVDHVRQGLSIYNLEEHRGHAFSYGGHDAAVCGRAIGGRSLWALGYLDQARRSTQAAIAFAETLGHGPSLAHALLFASNYHQTRRDAVSARVIAERLITVAEEHRLSLYRLVGGVIRGWAVAHQGLVEDGLAELSRNLATYDPDKPKSFSASCRSALAEVYLKAGDTVRALDAVEDALRAGERSGSKAWLAAILHVKGSILAAAAASRRQEAEGCFSDALKVARVQQAKSLELRAATSLARLWGEQGRRAEAHELLGPIYGWFTEGFDTADLKDAAKLLSELA
jgi:predicted ATPase